MIRLLSNRRRLLRKRMYKSPHERHRREYFRENRNLVKSHQKDFKNEYDSPSKRRKLRPKREVEGFKMSYRYKYYMDDELEDEL